MEIKIKGQIISKNWSLNECKQVTLTYFVGGELLFKISLNPHSIADDERCFFNSAITAGELPVYLDGN